MQEMDLIQICLFPSSISLYVYWQSRPLHEWPDLCLSGCCSRRFKMSGLPCELGAAADSPSPLLLSQLQPESHPSSFPVFSNRVFTTLVKRDLQTPSEGELLQGAEGQLGDEQQKKNVFFLKKVLRVLKWELTTCYAENLGISAAYFRLVRLFSFPPDSIR